jgi:hypothetical protein
MVAMAKCPVCNEFLGPDDLAPGKETRCSWCGNRIASWQLTGSTTAPAHVSPALLPADLPPLPAEPPASTTPTPKVTEETFHEEYEPDPSDSLVTQLRHLNFGTLIAFLAGSVALCLASFPTLSHLTKPLSVLGLTLGVLAGLVPALWKRRNLGLPVTMSALCLGVLLFAGNWPRMSESTPPPMVAMRFAERGMVAHEPIKETDWVDASVSAVKLNDLRLQIVTARIGSVEMEDQGKKALSQERCLVIRLRVGYAGIVFQALPYETWADSSESPSKHPPTLVDNQNQAYAQKTFPADRKIVGRGGRTTLTPGRMVEEVLVFEPPSAKVEYLRLTLPASAFGASGEFKLQIPKKMLDLR